MPLVVAAFFSVVFWGNYLRKRVVEARKPPLPGGRKRPKKDLWRHGHRVIGAFVGIVNLLYVFLIVVAFDIFDCSEREDGKWYMDQYPEHECKTGLQAELAPWALLCLFVYGVGIPVGFLCVLLTKKNRARIVRDQEHVRLRLKQKRGENVEYEFHNRWNGIYKMFEPEYCWWCAVILARKFAISFVSIMFNANPMFQASLGLLVIFVAFAAQMVRAQQRTRSDVRTN